MNPVIGKTYAERLFNINCIEMTKQKIHTYFVQSVQFKKRAFVGIRESEKIEFKIKNLTSWKGSKNKF